VWSNILETLNDYSIIDWIILVTGLIYAYFSMLNKPICWVFGIISCALLSYQDFTTYNLLFDGVLQIFYVLIGFLGLYRWIKRKTEDGRPLVISLPVLSHLNVLLLGTLISFVLVFLIKFIFNPSFAFLDCLTTVFSFWATWLLVNRVYDVWYYWIVINLLYIFIYLSQGADLFGVLYVVYLVTSIGGLFTWRKDYKGASAYLDNV
jgi:nicotinamide mononucleotide transporter